MPYTLCIASGDGRCVEESAVFENFEHRGAVGNVGASRASAAKQPYAASMVLPPQVGSIDGESCSS
jgi:hypothetical protein